MLEGLRPPCAQAAGGRLAILPAEDALGNDEPPPLSAVLDHFWRSGPEVTDLHVSPLTSEAPDALLRQLGAAPRCSGGQNLVELFAPAYARSEAAAERRALSG